MSNALTTFASPEVTTMSSREIAELTGKRHADVMRDIRVMLDQLILSTQFCVQYKDPTGDSFKSTYTDGTGRTLPMYALPKDLTLTLVAGYSAPLRHRIVTRWMALEARTA